MVVHSCNTCRKRRVKCDEAKPECYRCTRSGFPCLGYIRPTQWRHLSTAPFAETEADEGSASSTLTTFSRRNRVPVPPEIHLGAFEGDLCFARMLDNFVWRSFGKGWIDEAAAGKLGRLPLEAAKALSQTNFGRMEHADDLRRKGAVQYGQCLQQMVAELARRGMREGHELVAPIILLLMQAVFYPYRQWEGFLARQVGGDDQWSSLDSDRMAATSHLKGIAAILHFSGPEAFQRQPLTTVFDCARTVLAVAALYRCQRSFVEGERWRTIPWSLRESSKTEQSKLLDIFVMIPGLREEFENLSPSTAPKPTLGSALESSIKERRSSLRDRLSTQLAALFGWRWEWQNKYGHTVTVGGTTARPYLSTPAYLRRRTLKFESNVRAAEISFYDSILLWLLLLLFKLEQRPHIVRSIVRQCANDARSLHSSMTRTRNPAEQTLEVNQAQTDDTCFFFPLSAPGSIISLKTPGIEICRIYEWQSRNHRSSLGSEPIYMYLFPLGMAMSMLDADEDIRAWVLEMVSVSPVTKGYAAHRHTMVGFSKLVDAWMLDVDDMSDWQGIDFVAR